VSISLVSGAKHAPGKRGAQGARQDAPKNKEPPEPLSTNERVGDEQEDGHSINQSSHNDGKHQTIGIGSEPIIMLTGPTPASLSTSDTKLPSLPIRGNEICIPATTVFDDAALGEIINVDDAEAFAVTLCPFIVV
jgi:hypothetical protein